MEKQRKVKIGIIVALVVAVVGISIGFASIAEQLNISATAAVNPMWKIEFVDDNTQNLSTFGATVLSQPTLTATTINNLNVEFDAAGGQVVYTFKVKNKGSIKAKVGSLDIATPECYGENSEEANTMVCSNISISLEHTDGGEIGSTIGEEEGLSSAIINPNNAVKVGDTLNAGDTANMKLIIRYDGEAPTKKVHVNGINIIAIYEQAQ